jgi:hypothetical protein
MWLPNDIIAEVDRVARIYYVDKAMTMRWNAQREEGELRLLTGWTWSAKNGSSHQQGFKTMTVAYREAWYVLVARRATPKTTPIRLVKSA